MALRVQGIATPEGADFTVYNPAPQGLKLPALRAEVAEPGRLRPRLFLLLYSKRSQKLYIHAEILDTEPWYQHPVG